MARERMVTRTIEVTTAHITGLDITTSQVVNTVVAFTGNYDTETALKLAKKELDTDTYKVVVVNQVIHTEKLYGMPEAEFIENAVELDPETRKAY